LACFSRSKSASPETTKTPRIDHEKITKHHQGTPTFLKNPCKNAIPRWLKKWGEKKWWRRWESNPHDRRFFSNLLILKVVKTARLAQKAHRRYKFATGFRDLFSSAGKGKLWQPEMPSLKAVSTDPVPLSAVIGSVEETSDKFSCKKT
jgi:hypothetical protein